MRAPFTPKDAPRPDRDRFTTLRDHIAERRGGVRSRNTTSDLAVLGGERVLQAMNEELLQRRDVWTIMQSGAVE